MSGAHNHLHVVTAVETTTTEAPTTKVSTTEATTTVALITESPTTEALTTTVSFSLNGITYPNGSTVMRDDIGEGDNALLCTTDRDDCCDNFFPRMRAGEFYFPDGSQVPIQGNVGSSGYYRNRGIQLIRLNRQSNGILTGQFRCEIPSSIDANSVLYINIGMYVKYGPSTCSSFKFNCIKVSGLLPKVW